MTYIDENQEAIACIRMNVDAYDAELKVQADSDDIGEDLGKAQQAVQTAKHTTTSDVSLECADHPHFRGFHKSLVQFLQTNFPGESIDGSPLKVWNPLVIINNPSIRSPHTSASIFTTNLWR